MISHLKESRVWVPEEFPCVLSLPMEELAESTSASILPIILCLYCIEILKKEWKANKVNLCCRCDEL
jgi:hypothetical protein